MLKIGRGVISKQEIAEQIYQSKLKSLRDNFPLIGEEFRSESAFVKFEKFPNLDPESECLGYICLEIDESFPDPGYVLSNRGLKCFLNKYSRELVYNSYPELKLQGGKVQVLGIRIIGISNSHKSLKCELI